MVQSFNYKISQEINFKIIILGVFFELMTTDIKKPSPNTINDLRAMNFTMYLSVIDSDHEKRQKDLIDEMFVK